MKDNKLFIPLLTVSFVLALSLILNVVLFVNRGNVSGVTSEETEQIDDTEGIGENVEEVKFAIDEEFIGIWESSGSFYAFTENGEAFSFAFDMYFYDSDMEAERPAISSCRKGHLDENNTLIFTEKASVERFSYESTEPAMYIYSFKDLKFNPENKVGDNVYKESSEVLVIGDKKYLRTNSYDYVLTGEFAPSYACSWDMKDYYLHVVDANGNVIAAITRCDGSMSYGDANGNNWEIFSIDEESRQALTNALLADKNQQITLDYTGEILYSGPLSGITSIYYNYDDRVEYIGLPREAVPDNYYTVFSHLKK